MRGIQILVLSAFYILALTEAGNAQSYKEMMDDYQYNFYDVVKKAEAYFQEHGTGKGSGYKGYMRWKSENEGKFFPSGERSNVSPYFVQDAWKSIQSQQPKRGSRAGTNPWVDLGPYDADSVTSHYSQGIGRVETFFVDPLDTQKIYLGSRSGGFWRTTDGGKNWICSTDTLVTTGVNTLSASPTHSDSVVISLRNANNGYSQGAYISTNGGLTWKESGFNPTNLNWGGLGRTGRINMVTINPLRSHEVYIASDRGLYKSVDFLKTYTLIRSGNFTQVVCHPSNPNTVYAYDRNSANRNYILVSTNGGSSFSQSAVLTNNNNNTNMRIKVSKACPSCLYVASSNGIWKSTNQGGAFSYYSRPSTRSTGPQGFIVSDVDTSNMLYGYVDLDASSNGGQSFTQRTWWSTGNGNHTGSSYIHADLRWADAVNGTFYVGTDGYLCRSSDGGTSWEIISNGTGIREFYRFGISQSKEHLSMAGSQDNGTSIHKGSSWIEWNGGDGMEAIVHTLNDDWMIGSWQYGNRNRTKDGGASRHNVDHPDGSDWIAPMFFDPNHHMRVFSFSDKVYVSETYGRNWRVRDSISGNVRHATIAENNSNILLVIRNNKLYISYDAGNSLTDISSDLPITRSISDITFDPRNDSTVIITYDSYQNDNRRIYISHDLCKTWQNISFNLSNMPLRCVVIDHTDSSNIYVGGEIGVYYMPMNGNNWTLYSEGLPNVSIRELEIQWATNTLRAVAWGRGMWETKLVGRETYPNILDISVNEKPTDIQPVEDLPIAVTAEVDYSGTINEVYLMWSKDSAKFDHKIAMSWVSGNQYKTDTPIPNFVKDTEMYFKVFAKAENGNITESYKFNYLYRECPSRPNNVKATASQTNIMLGDSITLTGSGASTYEWSHGVSNGVAFAPTQTTIYKLTGRDPLNCAGYDSVTVTVNLPQSLEKGQFGSHFNLFPNPTTGKVVVDLGRELENVRVEVLDMTGKVVWIHREAAASTLELDLSALPASSYSVKIIHGDNAKVLGVIKR